MEKHLLLSSEEQAEIVKSFNLNKGEYRVLPDGTFAIVQYCKYPDFEYLLKTGVNMRKGANHLDEYAYTFTFKDKKEALKHLALLQA